MKALVAVIAVSVLLSGVKVLSPGMFDVVVIVAVAVLAGTVVDMQKWE